MNCSYAERVLSIALSIILLDASVNGQTIGTRPTDGLHEHRPSVYALTHAKIFTEAGRSIDDATLVVRNQAVVAIGTEVEVPSDAMVLDMTGKWIYPGFFDAYGEMTPPTLEGGAKHWNSLITPELDLSQHYRPDDGLMEKLRRQGVVAKLMSPNSGIIKGRSLLTTTSGAAGRDSIWKSDVALHLRLGVSRNRGRNAYPNSPMGAVALARQTFLDAQWYRQAWDAYHATGGLARPERNDALEALARSLDARQQVIIDGANELYLLRAHDFAKEFSLNAILRGSGQEYQRLDAVQATARPLILPVHFPKPPLVNSPALARSVDLDELMHWDLAPENPARVEQAGIRFAFTSVGLNDSADFLAQVRLAVRRGLSRETALRALTEVPAELYGVSDRLGTLAMGKSASFVVCDGEVFEKSSRIHETWIQGRRFENVKPPTKDLRGDWKLTIASSDGKSHAIVLKLTGKADKLTGAVVVEKEGEKSIEIKIEPLLFSNHRLTGRFAGKAMNHPGTVQFSGMILEQEAAWTMRGSILWPDGTYASLDGKRISPVEASPSLASEKGAEAVDAGASTPINYPLGAFGRTSRPEQPQHLLIKNATVWTCGPDGVLRETSILVRHGKIAAIGKSIDIPSDALVIDASGKHLAPGIIDCHSHMASDGGINEGTQAITAEVRIADFVDCNDIDIYRQLAGGVTTVNILHGSANPIGGQNQVIQLRWGELYDDMRFAKAPPGIKFALGENVKRSNDTSDTSERYPQSRMGVDQLMRDAFLSARNYQAEWARWERLHDTLPPRRDLELEALSQILRGERWVHCHSYRQDEILALLRTCEEFGIKIATFQHILEGYKVADAMARHGAMGSAFSDWWAYKMEAYDAIPYNGVLMHRSGVVVSFNSDDRELARHLNHEAAKAIRYGQLEAEEAIKFVTLNPAKQLRIDSWVGSLEVGKQADMVLWSGPPLALTSRCEQTWIDGRMYFDIHEDHEQRTVQQALKARLIQKVIGSGQTAKKASENEKPDEELWPRFDIYCPASN